jgi:hypothetical protein
MPFFCAGFLFVPAVCNWPFQIQESRPPGKANSLHIAYSSFILLHDISYPIALCTNILAVRACHASSVTEHCFIGQTEAETLPVSTPVFLPFRSSFHQPSNIKLAAQASHVFLDACSGDGNPRWATSSMSLVGMLPIQHRVSRGSGFLRRNNRAKDLTYSTEVQGYQLRILEHAYIAGSICQGVSCWLESVILI